MVTKPRTSPTVPYYLYHSLLVIVYSEWLWFTKLESQRRGFKKVEFRRYFLFINAMESHPMCGGAIVNTYHFDVTYGFVFTSLRLISEGRDKDLRHVVFITGGLVKRTKDLRNAKNIWC